jgi:hypothetical protein
VSIAPKKGQENVHITSTSIMVQQSAQYIIVSKTDAAYTKNLKNVTAQIVTFLRHLPSACSPSNLILKPWEWYTRLWKMKALPCEIFQAEAWKGHQTAPLWGKDVGQPAISNQVLKWQLVSWWFVLVKLPNLPLWHTCISSHSMHIAPLD